MLGDRSWRIDKHIPLALIVTIVLMFLGQTVTLTWWGANMNYRVDALEKQMMILTPQGERLIKLETKFDGLIDSVNEIKTMLRVTKQR